MTIRPGSPSARVRDMRRVGTARTARRGVIVLALFSLAGIGVRDSMLGVAWTSMRSP